MTPADTPVQDLIVWAAGLSALLGFGTAMWTIFSGPSRKNTTRLDEHAKRLDTHDLRLSELAQTQSGMPTKREMHDLEIAMEQLKGELKTMSAIMSGQSQIMERLEAIVSRHDNHLLDGSRK